MVDELGIWLACRCSSASPKGMSKKLLDEARRSLVDRLFPRFAVDLIVRKLGKRGIRITAREKTVVQKWVESGMKNNLTLFENDIGNSGEIKLQVTSREVRRIKGKMNKSVSEGLSAVVTATSQH